MKKLLAVCLALCMILTAAPVAVYAAPGEDGYDGMLVGRDNTVFAYLNDTQNGKSVCTLDAQGEQTLLGSFAFDTWKADGAGVMLTQTPAQGDAVNTLLLSDGKSYRLAPKYKSSNGYMLYVNDAGKYGVLNPDAMVILAAGFDAVSCYAEQNVFAAQAAGKWAIYSAAGALLTEFVFDSAPKRVNEYFLSSEIDGSAVVICAANGKTYDAVSDMSEGLIRVEKDGLYGFVGTNGEAVTDINYDYAEDFSDGLSLAGGTQFVNYYAYINKNGEKVFDASADYPNLGSFSNGYAAVEDYNNKFGFIDKTGAQTLAPAYDEVTFGFNSEGVAVVKLGNEYFFINAHGEKLNDAGFAAITLQNGFFAAETAAGKHALYSASAQEILEPVYENVHAAQPYIYVQFDGLWGVTDMQGEFILPCSYNDFEALGGVICLTSEGVKKYFDKDRNEYDSAEAAHGEFTAVVKNGKTGFVNAQGMATIAAALDAAPAFDENGIAAFSQDGKYGIINEALTVIATAQYDSLAAFDGRVTSVASKDGLYALVGNDGTQLTGLWFDGAKCFCANGFAVLFDSNYFYAVSPDGSIARVLDRAQYPSAQALGYSANANAFAALDDGRHLLISGGEYTITSLRVSKLPDKTEYKDGLVSHTGLDFTGLQVTAYFEGAATRLLTADDLKIFAPDSFVLGENDVTIEYMGKTAQFQIYVISGDRIITYPSASEFERLWEGDTIEFTSFVGDIDIELSVGDDTVTIGDIENGKSVHLSASGEFGVTVKLLDFTTATVLESEFYTLTVTPAGTAAVDYAVKENLLIGDSFSAQYTGNGAFATVTNLNYGYYDARLEYSKSLSSYMFTPHDSGDTQAQTKVSDNRSLCVYEPYSQQPAYAPGAFTVTASVSPMGEDAFAPVGDAYWIAIEAPVITTNAPGSAFTETVLNLTATLENTSLKNSDNSDFTAGSGEHTIAYVPSFTVVSGTGNIQEVTSDCTKTLFGLYKMVFTEGGSVTIKIKFNQICTCEDCLGTTTEFTGYSPEKTVTINIDSDTRVLTTLYLTPPTKRDYYEGEDFNAAGMRLIAEYSDTSSEVITNYDLTGFESTIGTHIITVSYGGKSINFAIRVYARELSRIEISSPPDKVSYIEAQPLNTDGLVVVAVYNNGAEEDVTKDCVIEGYTGEVGNEQKITVSYNEKSAYFYVDVVAKTLQSIDVTTMPDKTVYYEGEEFDPKGMVVSKLFNNGTSEPTTDYTWRSFTLGSDILVVTITLSGSLKTKILRFNVLPRTLRSLEITGTVDKLEYLEGDVLDLTGFELTAVYNNGVKAVITEDLYSVSGYTSTPGSKTVTIAYLDKSVSFSVFVRPKTLTGIEISAVPAATVCFVGSQPDYTGMKVDALYDNSTRTTLTDDDYNISYRETAPGELTVTVEYLTYTDSFTLEYLEVAEQGIRVDEPAKREYELGEELDLAGMKVYLVYNNGDETLIDDVTEYSVSGYDKDTVARHKITVTHNTKGYFTEFYVTVRNPVPGEITSDTLTVEGGFISSVVAGTTLSQLLSSLNGSQYIKVFDGETEVADANARIGTGMTVRLMDGETIVDEAVAVVKGDLDGNGLVQATDARIALRISTKLETPTEAQTLAGNVDGTGELSATDARTILRVATNLEEFSV